MGTHAVPGWDLLGGDQQACLERSMRRGRGRCDLGDMLGR